MKNFGFSLFALFAFVVPCLATWNERIVGGQDAEPSRYRWLVSLQRKETNFHFCAGALVTPDTIVTAAHCVTNPNFVVRVKGVGNSNLPSSTTTFEVAGIISHAEYTSVETGYDIAVVLLAGESSETPIKYLKTNEPNVGRNAKVIGWGATSQGGSAAQVLQEVVVPIQSQETCRLGYGSRIDQTMLCAGLVEGGKDACQGDSGGPLFLDDDEPTLVGVVSWGYGCAQPNRLGVYARVGYFQDWIAKHVDILHGVTRFPTSSPTQSPLPAGLTHAPTPSLCEDKVKGWKDSDGYDCDWYADDNNCEKFGDSYENYGYVAQEACCVCGGGQVPRWQGTEKELCECDGGNGIYEQCGFSVPELPNVGVCLLRYAGDRSEPPQCDLRGQSEFDFSDNLNRWFVKGCVPHPKLADESVTASRVRLINPEMLAPLPGKREQGKEHAENTTSLIAAGIGISAGAMLAVFGGMRLRRHFNEPGGNETTPNAVLEQPSDKFFMFKLQQKTNSSKDVLETTTDDTTPQVSVNFVEVDITDQNIQ